MFRYGLLIFFLSITAFSCRRSKKLDPRISLWRLDRIPYGTKYAYDNLSSVFPYAEIRTSSLFPKLIQQDADNDSSRTLIILSPAFLPDPDELNSLIRYAASGNQILISARFFEDTFLNKLHLKLQRGETTGYGKQAIDTANEMMRSGKNEWKTPTGGDSVALSGIEIVDPVRRQWVHYAYPGQFSQNYFEDMDTGDTRILGRNGQGKANFVRVACAHGGGIYVHAEPLAFSNFFLLHRENKSYYDLAFSWMPLKTDLVEWSDYFRYRHEGDQYSALHFLLGNRSLRWALWLTLFLFLVILLVESKRKQKAIAEIPRLRNASEDFVKTVGRLYLQQKNNQNLAHKMIMAFLENIRSAYHISTNVLDDEFAKKLAFRTGRPLSEVADLVKNIHDTRLNANLTDREIMHLYHKINQFNKPAS